MPSTNMTLQELQQLLALNPIPLYNMVQYQNNPNSFYAGEADKIPIEMANSSTSDDPDRRTKKSGKSGKDKVEIPNMHLVCSPRSHIRCLY